MKRALYIFSVIICFWSCGAQKKVQTESVIVEEVYIILEVPERGLSISEAYQYFEKLQPDNKKKVVASEIPAAFSELLSDATAVKISSEMNRKIGVDLTLFIVKIEDGSNHNIVLTSSTVRYDALGKALGEVAFIYNLTTNLKFEITDKKLLQKINLIREYETR